MGNLTKVRQRLEELYGDKSKHSMYQNIPTFVAAQTGFQVVLNEDWRGDSARYNYFKEVIDFKSKTVIEIGANTGFFALSFAYENPTAKIIAYEGNPIHAEFIRLIVDSFSLSNCEIVDEYVSYENMNEIPESDLMLHFNVMHHAGTDFDKSYVTSHQELLDHVTTSLNKIRKNSSHLMYQMGYNWGGNKQFPIFGDIQFSNMYFKLLDVFEKSGWNCTAIGVANKGQKGKILINHIDLPLDIHQINEIDRSQSLISEFYKRPIFFLQ